MTTTSARHPCTRDVPNRGVDHACCSRLLRVKRRAQPRAGVSAHARARVFDLHIDDNFVYCDRSLLKCVSACVRYTGCLWQRQPQLCAPQPLVDLDSLWRVEEIEHGEEDREEGRQEEGQEEDFQEALTRSLSHTLPVRHVAHSSRREIAAERQPVFRVRRRSLGPLRSA